MGRDSGDVRCTQCGNKYKRIGSHWAKSSTCEYPELTDSQRDILEAVLMVKGNITQHPDPGRNPFFQIASTNREFLEWLDAELGILMTGVRENRDAETMRNNLAELKDCDPEELNSDAYKTEYALNSRHLPFLSEYYSEWYSDDREQRIVPSGLERSPLKLRVLFALVGQIRDESRTSIELSFSRAGIERETLEQFFHDFGPSYSRRGEGQVVSVMNCTRFFEYIGDPIPGFEHKWRTQDEIHEPETECLACHGRYGNLSHHFVSSASCSGPSITPQQHEVLSGLLLAGAHLNRSEGGSGAQLQVNSTSRAYLEWVKTQLDWLANPIREEVSEEQAREQFEAWTGRDDLDSYNINAAYVFTTRMHPELLSFYSDWFDEPAEFLKTLEPTPLRCKLMFGRRGTVQYATDRTPKIVIHHGRIPLEHDDLARFFEAFNPVPSGKETAIHLHEDEKFLDFIGDPIPGCEGRWNGTVKARPDVMNC